jgi:5'-nucleotidase
VWDLSRAALRSRESAVADMVTDLIRNQFKVDVVLNNGGSFRGDAIYPPGPVTDTMLAEIDEFESNIYLLTIQGKYLRQILEHSASQIGRGGFLQVSGIQFTIDPEAPPQQLSTPNSTDYSISQPGERIHNIRILSANGDWLPLDPKQHYRLAANDFLVKRGGDRYYWFKKYGRNIQNTYSTMGGIITDSFRQHEVVNPKKPDGRITIR